MNDFDYIGEFFANGVYFCISDYKIPFSSNDEMFDFIIDKKEGISFYCNENWEMEFLLKENNCIVIALGKNICRLYKKKDSFFIISIEYMEEEFSFDSFDLNNLLYYKKDSGEKLIEFVKSTDLLIVYDIIVPIFNNAIELKSNPITITGAGGYCSGNDDEYNDIYVLDELPNGTYVLEPLYYKDEFVCLNGFKFYLK